MTNAQLCALALAAIDDADARIVLADAIEERGGWYDFRAANLLGYGGSRRSSRTKFRAGLQAGWPSVFRAIASVLLFGNWSRNLWPMMKKSRRPLIPIEQLKLGLEEAYQLSVNRHWATWLSEPGVADKVRSP